MSRKGMALSAFDDDDIDDGRHGVGAMLDAADDGAADDAYAAPAPASAAGFDIGAIDFDTGDKQPRRKGRKGRKAGGRGGQTLGAGLLSAAGGGSAAAPTGAGRLGFGAALGVGAPRSSSAGAAAVTQSHGGATAAGAAAAAGSERATSGPAVLSPDVSPEPAAGAEPMRRMRSPHERREVVSATGARAALARRRGRVRVGRLHAPLPRVPAPVVAAERAVAARHTGAKAARKAAKRGAEPEPADVAAAATAVPGEEIAAVVLGHVDSGKSTVVGHLLALTGLVSRREARANAVGSAAANKASFEHAWVMDRGDEERARGITIDVSVRGVPTAEPERPLAPMEGVAAALGLDAASCPPAAAASGAEPAMPNPGRRLCVLDAPGHRSLVDGAVSAAAQADVAVLVVPAPEGEFATATSLLGTAREHAVAARSLGVTRVVVALNKMDAVAWSEARFDAARAAMTTMLCGDLRFKPAHVVFVPVSGMEGTNLWHTVAESAAAEAAAAGAGGGAAGAGEAAAASASAGGAAAPAGPSGLAAAARWYCLEKQAPSVRGATPAEAGLVALPGTHAGPSGSRGLTLIETVRCLRSLGPKEMVECRKPLRLCVSDVFRSDTAGAAGTVVVGRVVSGWVRPRDKVLAVPAAVGTAPATVKLVMPAGGDWDAPLEAAWAGQTVEARLGGVTEGHIIRTGSVLCWPSHPIAAVTEAKVSVSLASSAILGEAAPGPTRGASAASAGGDDASDAFELAKLRPITIGSRLRWFSTTVDCHCRVVCILSSSGREDGPARHRPRLVKPGQRAVLRVRFEQAVPLEASKHHKRIGRFLLRQGQRSVAAGTVMRVYK